MLAIQVSSKEAQSRLAQRIVELSSNVLSKKENANYIALKVGDGPYSNAITVRGREDTVSFHIPSSDLVKQAIDAGFSIENRQSSRPFFKYKWCFHGLTLDDLQTHETLFRAIEKDSMEYILSRRPKEK